MGESLSEYLILQRFSEFFLSVKIQNTSVFQPVYHGLLTNGPLSVCAFLCTLLVQFPPNSFLSLYFIHVTLLLVSHYFYFWLFYSLLVISLCCTFFICHFFMLHPFCFTLSSYYILFVLLFFRSELFSYFAISMLHFFRVALFSCCTFFIMHLFRVIIFFHVALFPCCTTVMMLLFFAENFGAIESLSKSV